MHNLLRLVEVFAANTIIVTSIVLLTIGPAILTVVFKNMWFLFFYIITGGVFMTIEMYLDERKARSKQ